MMFKLVVTRGINTAFLLFIITGDTEQLDSATLQQVDEKEIAWKEDVPYDV